MCIFRSPPRKFEWRQTHTISDDDDSTFWQYKVYADAPGGSQDLCKFFLRFMYACAHTYRQRCHLAFVEVFFLLLLPNTLLLLSTSCNNDSGLNKKCPMNLRLHCCTRPHQEYSCFLRQLLVHPYTHSYSVSQKNPPPWDFLAFFPKRLGIFCPNFTRLLYIPIYARLQIFI